MNKNSASGHIDIQIRRLGLDHEFEQIKELQLSAREFTDHYPRHKEWLDMAIREMNKGERVAFGAIKPVFVSSGSHAQKVVGSIIIKKGTYSQVVEMKNMYLGEEDRGRGWGWKLYSEVESYCRRKGYRFIETEVPVEEIDTINFLHKSGFRISKNLDSRFQPHDQIYLMEKEITPSYSGDPFDFKGVCNWYLQNFWNLELIEEKRDFSYFTPLPNRMSLTSSSQLNSYRVASVVKDENLDNVDNAVKLASEHADIVILFHDDSETFQECNSTRAITKSTVYEEMKEHLGYDLPQFDAKDVAGLIVSFNPDIFSKVKQAAEKFPYYKGGPVGQYVHSGHKALLFSEGDDELPLGGIKAYATIDAIETGSPERVKSTLENYQLDPLIEDNLFQRFFSNKDNLIGLVLSDLKYISPMGESQIYEIFGAPPETDLAEIGHRYISSSELKLFLDKAEVMLESDEVEATSTFDNMDSFHRGNKS